MESEPVKEFKIINNLNLFYYREVAQAVSESVPIERYRVQSVAFGELEYPKIDEVVCSLEEIADFSNLLFENNTHPAFDQITFYRSLYLDIDDKPCLEITKDNTVVKSLKPVSRELRDLQGYVLKRLRERAISEKS